MTPETVLAQLQRRLAQAPHEDDTGSMNEQQRQWQLRQQLSLAIQAVTTALSTLREVEPQIKAFTKQQADLTAIRQELCDELLQCPPRSNDRREDDRIQGLKVSILCIDGRFNLAKEGFPVSLQLFEKLQTRGYVAPEHAPWNPMAALPGTAPFFERRLKELQKQHDEAQDTLDRTLKSADALLGEPVTV